MNGDDTIDLTDSAGPGDVLTLGHAAAMLGITDEAAERLIESNTFPIPWVSIGGKARISRPTLERWLAGHPDGDGTRP